jgi:hypothetical protein
VLGGQKGLYWFRQKIPTFSVKLLMLLALVCSRGYKWVREGDGPKSVMEESNGVESDSVGSGSFPPLYGASYLPFYRSRGSYRLHEKERERGGKGLLGSHRPSPPCVGSACLVDDDDRDGSTSWPICHWRHTRASSAGHGTLSHLGG